MEAPCLVRKREQTEAICNVAAQYQLVAPALQQSGVSPQPSAGDVTDALEHAMRCVDFARQLRQRLHTEVKARSVCEEQVMALNAIYSEERQSWVRIQLGLLDLREWEGRCAVHTEWLHFYSFAVNNEPLWRRSATDAAAMRVKVEAERRIVVFASERMSMEEDARQGKHVRYDEAKDWLACMKLMFEDEKENAKRRETNRINAAKGAAAAIAAVSASSSSSAAQRTSYTNSSTTWQHGQQAGPSPAAAYPPYGYVPQYPPQRFPNPPVSQPTNHYDPNRTTYGFSNGVNPNNNHGVAPAAYAAYHGLNSYQHPNAGQFAPPSNLGRR